MIIDNFDCFITSMKEIFLTMAGISLEPNDKVEHKTDDKKIIIGAMILRGENNYLITIETDYQSASLIISNMTGVPSEELQADDLVDGIQELVNMVAGSTKNNLEALQCGFTLTSTFAFKGNDVSFFTKKGINKKSAYFKSENIFISLNIYNM